MEMTINYFTLKDLFPPENDLVTISDIQEVLEDYFENYVNLSNISEEIATLLKPLILRWNSPRIALALSESDELSDSDKYFATKGIWDKLDLVLTNKLALLDKYNEMIKAVNFSNETVNTSTSSSRFNDTPTSQGNYSAKEYTTNITQGETTNKSSASTNEYETYDILADRLRNISQEIINEMKEFETWI